MSDVGIALAIIIPVCIIGVYIAVILYKRRQRQIRRLAREVIHNPEMEVKYHSPMGDPVILRQIHNHMATANNSDNRNITWKQAVQEYMAIYRGRLPHMYPNFDPDTVQEYNSAVPHEYVPAL